MDEHDFSNDDCDSLFHDSTVEKKDVLFAESFEVSHGSVSMPYSGGLDERWEAALAAQDNRVGGVILRLHCIEPQTGQKVPMTFLMPPGFAAGLSMNLNSAAFHEAAGAADIWEAVQAVPDEQGLKVAASWKHLEDLEED